MTMEFTKCEGGCGAMINRKGLCTDCQLCEISAARKESEKVLQCEYCGIEFKGDIDEAIKKGWQHGYDASFCPKHNV